MNILRKDIDAVNAVLTIEVSKDDYQPKVEKTLRDYRKKVSMPGFRQGMVPAGLVKKMYGKAITAEEIDKTLSEVLNNYIKENNLNVLGEPLPNESEQRNIDLDTQENFEFVFDLGLAPNVNPELSPKDKITNYRIAVTEEMIDNQVKSYTGRFGSYIQVEEANEKDVIKGEIAQLETEDGINEKDVVLSPAYIKNDEQKQLFSDKKIGDKIVFNPKKAFENESEIASLLKVKKEEVAGIDGDFEFTITGITRYVESEIDQSLFDKVFGEGAVTSEEEFRNKIKENILTNLEADANYKFGIDAKEYIMKKLDNVLFPTEFLKRWVLASNKNLTADELDKDFPEMIAQLKWQQVIDQTAQKNDIKVEFEDIQAFAKKIAQSQFAQYGMANVPDEVLANYTQDMLKDEKSIRNIVHNALHERVMENIKATVTLEEKEISIEEFNKFFEQTQQ